MRWYPVPTTLAIYSLASDLCWRGCGQRGTFIHIWWECPVIKAYWVDIKAWIAQIFGINLPFSPLHFLLHAPALPLSHYKRSTIPYLLNAAKCLIPIQWKSVCVPIHKDWIRNVTETMEAEEWIATCKGMQDCFDTICATWSQSISGLNEVSSILDVALFAQVDFLFRQLVQVSR